MFALAFVLASRYDMAVSSALTDSGLDFIVYLGDRLGFLPAFLVPAWCIMAMGEIKEPKWAYRFVSVGFCACAAYIMVKPDLGSMSGMMLLIVTWALFYMIINAIPNPECTDRNITLMRLGILITFSTFITVQFLKMLWGRPRFIAIQGGEADFAEWFRIAGLAWRDDYYRSFPSGHTAGAASIFFITFLPEMYPALPQKKWAYWVFSVLYTLFVAVSRIIAGMHFISDVTAGCAIYLIWHFTWLYIAHKKGYLP